MSLGSNPWPYQYAVVPIEEFVIDHSYQRPSKPEWVTKAKEVFDERLIGALIANLRDDGYSLIDGQQRWLLLKENGYETAPTIVHTGLTVQEEARLFASLNFEQSLLRTWFHYRALRRANDPEILAIDATVEAEGFEVGDDYNRENFLSCPGSVTAIYRGESDIIRTAGTLTGPEVLSKTLQVLNATWRNRVLEGWPKAKGAGMVRGIARWISAHEEIPVEDIAAILQPVHPETIITEASNLTRGTGSGKGRKIEAVIDNFYKKKSRGGRRAA